MCFSVIFDIIGMAVTAANMKVLLENKSRDVKGANIAIWLVKNAEKVSCICTDVVGDICSIKNANRKIELCKQVGLAPCMPLWNKAYEWLYSEMNKRRLKCLLSSVRPIIKDYAGKILDDEIYEKFKNIEMNPFGEMGEFHSTLLDLDIFKFPIQYEIKSIYRSEDKFGEKWEIDVNYFK